MVIRQVTRTPSTPRACRCRYCWPTSMVKLADFWVLDVEGAEGMILENTPPSAKIVFVEHNAIVVKRDRIHAALVAAGYYRFLAEPQDDWYVLKSHCHEFDKCFEFPPEYIHPRFKTG
eukprot:Sspe_Gene.49861::Locus_27237_Transcript_1_1_Confidence_1.000_Length_1112::g.49861::m.49861